MTAPGDQIEIGELYRGVGIHDAQPRERIEEVVKPAIDSVLGMAEISSLADYAAGVTHAPEARLLAAAKVQAIFEAAVSERRERPAIDIAEIRASVAGLASRKWRSPFAYCSLLDPPRPPGEPGPVPRDPQFQQMVRDARASI